MLKQGKQRDRGGEGEGEGKREEERMPALKVDGKCG